MAYQLIAVDMDGTLLNSKKEITPRTAAAVTQALARGYHVVMATGRCYRQIAPYMRRFPAMRYGKPHHLITEHLCRYGGGRYARVCRA